MISSLACYNLSGILQLAPLAMHLEASWRSLSGDGAFLARCEGNVGAGCAGAWGGFKVPVPVEVRRCASVTSDLVCLFGWVFGVARNFLRQLREERYLDCRD